MTVTDARVAEIDAELAKISDAAIDGLQRFEALRDYLFDLRSTERRLITERNQLLRTDHYIEWTSLA